jgi:CRISPR-associated protein Csx10
MNAITYQITLEEPVLVTALGGEPNGSVALNHLPGSVLRGAAIGAYLRRHNRADLEAGDLAACRLFLDGRTRFLNAYPLAGGRRSLPTPLSWYRRKEDEKETDLHDFAIEEPSEEDDWQPASSPFRVLEDEGSSAVLIRLGRQVSVHTARNRRFGRPQERTLVRPDEDPGAVYRSESLAPKQTFAGVVLCEPADTEVLLSLLKGPALLGGARSAGYGRVHIHDAAPDTSWIEEPAASPSIQPGVKVIFSLLSDALVRDEAGQLSMSPAAIARALGVTLAPGEITAFIKETPVGGFNRKWGLPLSQALAVAMGSVLVFREAPGLSEGHLRKLVEEGIGERRSEGFGRVAVNAQAQSHIRGSSPGASRAERVPPLSRQTEARELAMLMTGRMLRQRLDAGVANCAVRLRTERPPSKSQLARLRLLARNALDQVPGKGRQRLFDYLNGLERRQTTRRQFTRYRIAGYSSLEWLRSRINDTSDIWDQLDVRDPPRVGGIEPARDDALAYEYNLRLIDAVLARTGRLHR